MSALVISLAAGVLEMTSNSTQVLATQVGEEVLDKRDPAGPKNRHRPAQGGHNPTADGANDPISDSRNTSSTGGASSGNSGAQAKKTEGSPDTTTGDKKDAAPDTASDTPADSSKKPAAKPAEKDKQSEEKTQPQKAQKKNSGSTDTPDDGKSENDVVAENEYDPSCYRKNGKLRKRCR